MSKKSNRFSPEVRERAVRMVQEHRGEYPLAMTHFRRELQSMGMDARHLPLGLV
ncbi:hypothetical protein LHU53_05160 [Rhodoferax sp. U2-2l]|uniref:hypothetical protein n=1 Tax=Rhodoferax sp. U2-2l TaxID=2884000 RepID=UPI001D09AC69|nr:hypothetical protein [Rhodoferax sp. U2-2l]MCB8746290.1 hypothetical protein [Rhodoferax sp. U2-2l]